MRYAAICIATLLSVPALAAPSVIVVPQQQKLTAVEYSNAGKQTGCGLRITGVTAQNLSLNVLITVFIKDSGNTFGVVKVVARNSPGTTRKPVTGEGASTAMPTRKIHKAWIKPETGRQQQEYRNGLSLHNDAYMVTTEFASTVDLLIAISKEKFRVGLNRNESGSDDVFQFDQRISREEVANLTACMSNLRNSIEESKHNNIL